MDIRRRFLSKKSSGGDVYSIMYTSSDGNVVTPKTTTFGAIITSNTYVNGQGIITFDKTVSNIGSNAFDGCTLLTSITIPNSVVSIGQYAFRNCESLTSIIIHDSVTSIGYGAFQNCESLPSVIIPNNVISIGDFAFASCTSMTSITIPNSVTSIGDYAFNSCSSLANITIPNGVTSIGYNAFYNCSSLTSVIIPDSVTSLGNYAFDYCHNLISVTIGKGVTSIGTSAFCDCGNLKAFYGKYASSDNRCLIVDGVLNSFAPAGLTEYTIPNSVTSIGGSAFASCTSLTSITIPDSVTRINGGAFYNCSGLTSVNIPDSVTTIEEDAFASCSSLPVIDYVRYADTCVVRSTSSVQTTYPIKESTKFILMKAFYGCNKVTSITIPQDVINVGAEAFCNCSALTTVYCKPSIPPKIYKGNRTYWNAFIRTSSNLTIYVPTASVDAYKSATGWKDYADYIVEYDF